MDKMYWYQLIGTKKPHRYKVYSNSYAEMHCQSPNLSFKIEGSHKYSKMSLKLGQGTVWTLRISSQYTDKIYAHCGNGSPFITGVTSGWFSSTVIILFLNS